MFFTKFFTIVVAVAPLTLAASVYKDLEQRDELNNAPSKRDSVREEILAGLPCPGLKAMMMKGLFDKLVTDWSKPYVGLADAQQIFHDTLNLKPDFTKFTVSSASKLSKPEGQFKAGAFFSLKDIRSWDATSPDAGQIVHEACISREDPHNGAAGKYTPRPFDPTTFNKYLGRLDSAKPITPAVQALARKAEVDAHKNTITPLAFLNVWAESALLLTALSADGTGKSVPIATVKNFFEKGVLPTKASSEIGMPTLLALTAELLVKGYKSDLKGLLSLVTRFGKEEAAKVAHDIHHLDPKALIEHVVTLIKDEAIGEMKDTATKIEQLLHKVYGAV